MKEPYAHSANSQGQRHRLVDHLNEVASLAKIFADKFGAGDLAYWAGLWHDVGKFHPAFQEYLLKCEGEPEKIHRGPDHKGAGAFLALKHLEPLVFLIAGHHGGLPNSANLKAVWLPEKSNSSPSQEALNIAKSEGIQIVPQSSLLPPTFVKTPLDGEFFIRMLFSALVDADFLDTESHFNPKIIDKRGGYPSLNELWCHFEENQKKITGKSLDQLNIIRNEVYENCLDAAELPPGFFKLTVPTGGGKTRSSMAFGLKHAIRYRMDRVIVAIPYTSIIEQTAEVYREIFGKDVVLEHHSAVTPSENEDAVDDGTSWARLAAENWYAPIVVTTTVQLFESLFSNKTSRCRKLHNIVNSVIILDEVQTLPTGLLTPILDALRQLVSYYKVTVVFCTATQPALESSPYQEGIDGIREIVPEPKRSFSMLKRVEYTWVNKDEKWDWARVATEMRKVTQCMTVVNTKKDAISLLDALDDPSAIHISTLLCGEHRRDVLRQVRNLIADGKPCRLVSTQVVEAGVDLDFPLVLRAVGPLDRIVQAAGRCNREGKLSAGKMIIFSPEDGGVPPGDYCTGTDTAMSLLNYDDFDFHNPLLYEEYFKRLYQAVNLDKDNIQELRQTYNYRDVDARFQMIKKLSISVIVKYYGTEGKDREVDKLLPYLKNIRGRSPSILLRRLQPFIVSIPEYLKNEYQRDGLIVEIKPGLWEWLSVYDKVRGLVVSGINPEDLVVTS
ncbi:MAG: CRISPR-associated helicase Cas3' [Candidatus Brocadia sp.]|nr:CRISPR-associated helicase Cas3' [Candidatus Brocadia sp.]